MSPRTTLSPYLRTTIPWLPKLTRRTTLAALVLLWATANSSPSRAAYVALYDATGTGPATAITFAANGFLHGTLSVTTAELHDDAGHVLRSVAITNGVLAFGLGVPYPSTLGRFTYAPGGFLTLTGNLGGGPSEVILSTGRLFGAASGPDSADPGTYRLVDTAYFAPTLAVDFAMMFGGPGVLSVFGLEGFGQPGSVTTASAGATGGIDVVLAPGGTVPEPSSAGMLGVGMVVAGGMARRMRR